MMLWSSPYFQITKELETKHDYISSLSDTGMIALVSELCIAWLERDDEQLTFFRHKEEPHLERLSGIPHQSLILFLHSIEQSRKENCNSMVLEIKPNRHICYQGEKQRWEIYLHQLSVFYDEYKSSSPKKGNSLSIKKEVDS
jgi:hypothetical protein